MLPLTIDLSIGHNEQRLDYRLSCTGEKEYAVYLNNQEPLFYIKRLPSGLWEQIKGEGANADLVRQLGEELNEMDQLEFEFPLVYEGEGVLCRVAMGESGFAVLINNRLVAEIDLRNEDFGWEVTNGGPLHIEALEEIGEQIERHMK